MLATGPDDVPVAAHLAGQLGLPLVPAGTAPGLCRDYDILLTVRGSQLALQQTARPAPGRTGRRDKAGRGSPAQVLPGPVSVDFGSDGMRHRRRSGHNELLGKAVGVSARRCPRVLDATAGLGRDSFVLADMGCAVTLCEREPVLAALLAGGLQAALDSADDWLSQVARRMRLVAVDARELAPREFEAVDVIYLDPMFPARDKSAAVKKEMALFQLLLHGGCAAPNEEELLLWALARDVARVVVKRPCRAPFLAGRQPSHSVAGRAVRFDVHVRRALG